jgi:hypothetical protein
MMATKAIISLRRSASALLNEVLEGNPIDGHGIRLSAAGEVLEQPTQAVGHERLSLSERL